MHSAYSARNSLDSVTGYHTANESSQSTRNSFMLPEPVPEAMEGSLHIITYSRIEYD